MSKTRIQLRGNCQCCGRFQAVTDGRLAHHGYTVENGYFRGTCSGHQFAPLQLDRKVADCTVATVRADVARAAAVHRKYLAKGLPGDQLVPRPGVFVRRGQMPEMVRVDSLHGYDLQRATDEVLYTLDNHVRAGTAFADQLEDLANKLHGTALQEVEVAAPAAAIVTGEKRISNGRALTVRYTERGRVYWQDERGMRSWTGCAAWRKLPPA